MKIDPELTMQIDTDDPNRHAGLSVYQATAGAEQAVHRCLLYNDILRSARFERFRNRDCGVPGYFSDGLRRYSGCRVSHSESDYGATAVTMGEAAAQVLLERIEGQKRDPSEIAIEPDMVVRELSDSSSGSIAISEGYSFCPSIRSNRTWAATSPIRFNGCCTVVRLGV